MASCAKCGRQIRSGPGGHVVDGPRCRTFAFVRERRAEGLVPVGKQWGEYMRSIGVRVIDGPVSWNAGHTGGTPHANVHGPVHGRWVERRYAELASRTKIPPGLRRSVLQLMAAEHEHLAAIEAALHLDPSSRAAIHLIKDINANLTNPTNRGMVGSDAPRKARTEDE